MNIKLHIIYNRNNNSASEFVDKFMLNLSYCLKRFKCKSEWTAKPQAADHIFIAIDSNDTNPPSFHSSINVDEITSPCDVIFCDKINPSSLPFPAHKFPCFNFWDIIAETNEIRKFSKESPDTAPQYWELLTDIATEISQTLDTSNKPPNKTIYLAQTDTLQMPDWLNVKRDLNEMGYKILPDKPLSTNLQECTEQINNHIKNSSIIIHLIPIAYSRYFTNSNLSITEHQLNISSEMILNTPNRYKRIIWIPTTYEFMDEENQIFIERIQRDNNQQHSTIILKVTLEDLKKMYRQMLLDAKKEADNQQFPSVYYITDDTSDTSITPANIVGNSTSHTMQSSLEHTSYNQHLRYLANAQVVVLKYSHENEQWINVKINDILKSPGLETSMPNKRLILIKTDNNLNTSKFDTLFDEVKVIDPNSIKLSMG